MTKPVLRNWPVLLTADQLSAYLNLSDDAVTRICPVRPVDIGLEVLLWSRPQIDDWAALLATRPDPRIERAAEAHRSAALERARTRALSAMAKRRK